jgi:hypothetical protein
MHGGLGKLLRNLEELQVIICDIFEDLMNLKLKHKTCLTTRITPSVCHFAMLLHMQ